jgi:hypothetical protein
LNERIPLISAVERKKIKLVVFSYQSTRRHKNEREAEREKEKHCISNTATIRCLLSLGSLTWTNLFTPSKTGHYNLSRQVKLVHSVFVKGVCLFQEHFHTLPPVAGTMHLIEGVPPPHFRGRFVHSPCSWSAPHLRGRFEHFSM